MTVTDQIKILDKKIKQSEAQYDLDRKASKISALSSNIFDKSAYLTGEDLDIKQSTVEQAKLEYSPLGKFFNKGLKEEEKKEGLLKRLTNIEDKNEEQLKAIEDQKEIQTKIISKYKIEPPLLKSIYNQEVKDGRINKDAAKKIFKTLENLERSETNYSKLVYKSGDNKYFDFNFTRFGPLSSFYLKLMNGDIGINVVKLNMKKFKKDRYARKKENKKRAVQKK